MLEPLLASVLVAMVSWAFISGMQLRAFTGLEPSHMQMVLFLGFLNGVVLTFAGAWAGEKLQGTYEAAGAEAPSLAWGWIMAGVIVGATLSLVLTSVSIVAFGLYAAPLMGVVFFGLMVTGFVCAVRSPGNTAAEAAVAGLITVILLIDAFVLSLDQDGLFLTGATTVMVLVLGVAASLFGGFAGEKVQERSTRTRRPTAMA